MSTRIGVAVHPERDVHQPVDALREWASERDADVVQVEVEGQQQQVAPFGDVEDCDVVVAIGGDGTALAAIRAAAPHDRPVLGVACGSLGALTAVEAHGLPDALKRFQDDGWRPMRLPALEVTSEEGEQRLAFNDVALVRAGGGQLRLGIHLDDTLYGRIAGDGAVVSTPVGSAAYTLAAGGPILHPDAPAFVCTPLPSHGGFIPALVAAAGSRLQLEILGGFAGARLEVDGRVLTERSSSIGLRLFQDAATIVSFDGQEPFLAGLRRRGVLVDSPRLLAEDRRKQE